jgi:hypothetical protein
MVYYSSFFDMEDTGLYGGDLYGGQRTPFVDSQKVAKEPAQLPPAAASAFATAPDVDTMTAAPTAAHAGYDPSTGVYRGAAGPRDQVSDRPAEIVKERRPVSDDDDQATAETVKIMCEYIAAGVNDPVCKLWACHAVGRYGLGSVLPAVCAWSVFWMLKHCVRFIRDEGRLFMSGDGAARDRLVAPAVLVRQKSPAEDCDGFTMLACCLLRILQVPCFIVTLKADPRNPARWSHVFAMAELPDGSFSPVDASHGKFPGWMVPKEHIFAYQVWDMDGRPTNRRLPAISHLHGYVKGGTPMGRGLGFCPIDPNTGDTLVCADPNSPGGGGGINWGAILGTLITTAGKVAVVAEAPPGSVINPSTGGIVTGGPFGASSTLTATTSNLLPWMLGGALLVGLIAFGGGGRRR